MYRILRTESPIWDPFPIHHASQEEEDRAIRDLENNKVRWALISNTALDGMPERCFSRTHPRTWRYLQQNFEPEPVSGLPKDLSLMRKRG